MVKTVVLFSFFGIALVTNNLVAQFKLNVNGMTKKQGNLMIAIYDSESHFMDKNNALKQIVYPVKASNELIEINGLSTNKAYAIAIYHDVNINSKLDTNIFGLPTEVYGFSNDARGIFGPPSYDEAKVFYVKNKTLTINLK